MQPETMLEKDIFPEINHEEKLVQEKDESTLIDEAVGETEMVGKLISPLVEEVDMKAYEETEAMVSQDSLSALEQQIGWFLRHELVKQNYSSAPVLEEIDSVQFLSETLTDNAVNEEIVCDSQVCVHSFQRVPSKRQRKCFKSWKFKFKEHKFLLRVTRQWEETLTRRWLKVLCVWSGIWRTLINVAAIRNIKWNFSLPLIVMAFNTKNFKEGYNAVYGSRLKQFALEDGKFQVKHKWRFKHTSFLVFSVMHPIYENASKVFISGQWQMSQLDGYSVLIVGALTASEIVYVMELVQQSVHILRKLSHVIDVQTFMDI